MLQAIKTQISGFIHSTDFWYWHGFVLSILWLIGTSIGILIKKYSLKLHILAFAIVDYTSLFFMGSAIYLILPLLPNFAKWPLVQKIHIIGGLIFLVLMNIQHIGGAIYWHKQQPNRDHRRRGTKLAHFGRILAMLGWLIHQERRNYAIAVSIIAIGLYLLAEKKQWQKIKIN